MTDLRTHLATATHAIAKLHVEAEALAMEHVARLDALCAENERLRGELADWKARALERGARDPDCEIRYDEKGRVDEVCGKNLDCVHLEDMGDHFALIFSHGGGAVFVNVTLSSTRTRVKATVIDKEGAREKST